MGWKGFLMIGAIFIAVIIGIPSLAIYMTDKPIDPIDLNIDPNGFAIELHRSKQDEIVQMPLELYIRGVVAAEMPAEFELEALKAQALAARTYFINRWSQNPRPISDDHRIDQAYLSDEQLRTNWGSMYDVYSNKINQAINETSGLILTYNQQPIEAYFFSTSNGYTENSEDVWSYEIPYLRSVVSPGDTISPKFKETKTISLADFHDKLGLTVPVSAWKEGGQTPSMVATKRSQGNRIIELAIGDQIFSGREIREKLGLNSTHFAVALKGEQIQFTTYGYGHGVGMSQWGAEAMAREGKKADEIAKYFYQGIEVQPYMQVKSLLPKIERAMAGYRSEQPTAQAY